MKSLLIGTFRFTIVEFVLVLPNPIANYIASLLLPLEPWILEGQIRNYLPIYLISTILYVICFVYTVFLLGEVKEVISPNDDIIKRLSLRSEFIFSLI